MRYGKPKGNPIRGGAYTPKDFPGYKCLSSSRHGQSSGKLSSEHGTNSGSPTKGMSHGANRLGHDTRGFKSGGISQGPHPIGKKKD